MGKGKLPPAGVSVVMIGRDEERFLPLTLPPLLRVASELVFVDTGSRDGTRELVRAQGGRLLERPWDHDFAAARNFGLEHARYRWILCVDCDEELVVEEGTAELFRQIGKLTDHPALLVRIDNLTPDGGAVAQDALRLFRNDPRIRFRNPVHESVAEVLYRIWPHHALARAPVVLRHHGYSQGTNPEKLSRNMEILRRWVEREPDNVFALYKYGANLLHTGDPPGALHHLERACGLLEGRSDRFTYPFLPQLVATTRVLLEEAGRPDRAARVERLLTRE